MFCVLVVSINIVTREKKEKVVKSCSDVLLSGYVVVNYSKLHIGNHDACSVSVFRPGS